MAGSVRRAAGSGVVLRARGASGVAVWRRSLAGLFGGGKGGGGLFGGLLGGLFGRASAVRCAPAASIWSARTALEPFIAPANGRIVSNGALQRMSQSGASSAAVPDHIHRIDARARSRASRAGNRDGAESAHTGIVRMAVEATQAALTRGVSVTEFPPVYVTSLTRHLQSAVVDTVSPLPLPGRSRTGWANAGCWAWT